MPGLVLEAPIAARWLSAPRRCADEDAFPETQTLEQYCRCNFIATANGDEVSGVAGLPSTPIALAITSSNCLLADSHQAFKIRRGAMGMTSYPCEPSTNRSVYPGHRSQPRTNPIMFRDSCYDRPEDTRFVTEKTRDKA
jgi:hypothetical protein